MLKKCIFVFLIINIFYFNSLYSYDRLWVEDPQRTWRDGYGTIEEAVISIRPRGLFMEYGLYLTISARGLNFSNSDTLEVQFNFELPEEAIVHDSWLWIGDEIIRGKIMDKWTASSIYEDIVNRRRDPSILLKKSKTQYELRIFPMAGNESRKVKITYLAPTQWNANNVMAGLPTNLLRTSKYKLAKLSILSWLDREWKNPKILEFPDIKFKSYSDYSYGNYLRADIPSDAINSELNFAIDAPLKNGIYVNKSEYEGEGYYQMAFLPAQALDLSQSYKLAVLFDYDASNSNISETEILANVKSLLHSNFAPTDSFNLIFSQLNINRASEAWLPIDSLTIEHTFSNLGDHPIASYSNLPSLLANGIDFVKTNGNNGSLLLISNSDQVGDYQVANQLIEDLINIMNPNLPIHIADFQNQNYSSHRIGARYYYGNEYFYDNISRLTTANYYNMRSGKSFSELMASSFQGLSSFIGSFDMHTKLENGFCYARFNLNADKQSTYLNRPLLQVGKYQGAFPMIIETSGIYENYAFSKQFKIHDEDITQIDSLSREIWVGNYIQSLESQTQTNDIISEIIYHSIKERILSIYSAFLCLEPSRGGEICYDCMDETKLVSIENSVEIVEEDSVFQAYPNPFNSQTTIKIKLPQLKNLDNASFKIYNMLGQVVRRFSIDQNPQNQYQITWYGKNDIGKVVSSGTYFFVVSTQQNNYSLKLLHVK